MVLPRNARTDETDAWQLLWFWMQDHDELLVPAVIVLLLVAGVLLARRLRRQP